MTEQERKDKAMEFWCSSKVSERVGYLAGRWADEKEYEDIAEYQKNLQELANKYGIKILSMTKRPFGFIFVVIGFETVEYQYKAPLSGSWSYKRIK
jgi:hypothetical protein